MNKKYLLFASALLAFLSSCTKEETTNVMSDSGIGYVSYTNVNASNKQTNVFVDGVKVNNVLTSAANTAIAPNGTITGTYFGMTAGSHTLLVKDSNLVTSINYYTAPVNIEEGKSYSFFLYDTLTTGNLKGVLLNTDRTADANVLNARVRFLNLSPKSPALDFWMIRRQGAVAKDSVMLFSGMPYLGNVATPDINALSTFKPVLGSQAAGAIAAGSGATDYIVRVKVSGTNTIVSSTAAMNIVPSRNYTFFARGIYPATTILNILNN